jgi:hypothetical protein
MPSVDDPGRRSTKKVTRTLIRGIGGSLPRRRTNSFNNLLDVFRFWWHRLRGHKFALRGLDHVICLRDLTVLPRHDRYR